MVLRIWLGNTAAGPTVFAQILAGVNRMEMSRAEARFPMPRASRSLSGHDHFAAMVFAQLTYRESLRGIETCLGARPAVAYQMGFRGRVTRTNLAYANDHRDWRVFAEVAAVLMRRAQRLNVDTTPAPGLEADLFALDATVIELSMALFPWARWKKNLASVKLNVLLDLRRDIPVFASLHEGKRHEVASLDELPVQSGSYYVMDRGYLDFARLHRLHRAGAFFVTRLKSNTSFYVAESRPVENDTGLRCDQTIKLNSYVGRRDYPDQLRRISFLDTETAKALVFVTNQFDLDPLINAQIYRRRWAIELFFRWIKQHLRLRGFYSTSFNGVRVQIWSAISAYLLVAIAKRRLHLPHSLWEILQIVSIASMEQVPLSELLATIDTRNQHTDLPNQLEINYSQLDSRDTTLTAIAEGGRDGECRLYGTISSDLHALEKVLRKLGGESIVLHVVYEAGPTGYVVFRRLQQLGIDCIVVAPSRTPQPKGSRQKTDRRDAMILARLHRAGELTSIHIPDALDESIRDLTRTRADAVHDLTRAKQRLKSFLLRQGYRYSGKANWSDAHQRYLRELVLPLPALKSVLEEYLLAIEQRVAAVGRLDDLIAAQIPQWRMYPAVQALMGMRGFQLYAAAVVVCELGDIYRFRHLRHLMAFLGLIPKEHTTGESRKLGGITKTGNSHARWILGEVVQHAFLPPKVSAHLSRRQQGLPPPYKELSWKMQTRLYQRSRHLIGRSIIKPKVTVALARELCGFIWALLRQVRIA